MYKISSSIEDDPRLPEAPHEAIYCEQQAESNVHPCKQHPVAQHLQAPQKEPKATKMNGCLTAVDPVPWGQPQSAIKN